MPVDDRPFDEQLRERLFGAEVAPPERLWSEVEGTLPGEQPKRRRRFFWLWTLGLLFALAGGLYVLVSDQNVDVLAFNNEIESGSTSVEKGDIASPDVASADVLAPSASDETEVSTGHTSVVATQTAQAISSISTKGRASASASATESVVAEKVAQSDVSMKSQTRVRHTSQRELPVSPTTYLRHAPEGTQTGVRQTSHAVDLSIASASTRPGQVTHTGVASSELHQPLQSTAPQSEVVAVVDNKGTTREDQRLALGSTAISQDAQGHLAPTAPIAADLSALQYPALVNVSSHQENHQLLRTQPAMSVGLNTARSWTPWLSLSYGRNISSNQSGRSAPVLGAFELADAAIADRDFSNGRPLIRISTTSVQHGILQLAMIHRLGVQVVGSAEMRSFKLGSSLLSANSASGDTNLSELTDRLKALGLFTGVGYQHHFGRFGAHATALGGLTRTYVEKSFSDFSSNLSLTYRLDLGISYRLAQRWRVESAANYAPKYWSARLGFGYRL